MKYETFIDFHNALKTDNFNNKQKGDLFEMYCLSYFQKVYKDQIHQISLWDDWKYNQGEKDNGIDIVLETNEGEFWSIQCKYHSDETGQETLSNVSTFFAASNVKYGDKIFSKLILCTVSISCSKSLQDIAGNFNKDVSILTHNHFSGYGFDTSSNQIIVKTQNLRSYQKEALENIQKAFVEEKETKGILVMACGTGKTFTSLKLVESLDVKFVLFLVPTIALIEQVAKEYNQQASKEQFNLIVCSDATVKTRDKTIKRDEDQDTIDMSIKELKMLTGRVATTNTDDILKWFKESKESENIDKICITFSTYHSLDRIKEAYDKEPSLPIFDLVLCDEAHNTVTNKQTFWGKILDESYIKRKHCLYMTATPKMFTDIDIKSKKDDSNIVVSSMNDENDYGKCLYEYSFNRAIKDNVLCDVRVGILQVDINDDDLTRIKEDYFIENINALVRESKNDKSNGVLNSIRRFLESDTFLDISNKEYPKDKIDKIINFTKTIENSKTFVKFLNQDKHFKAEHVDGKIKGRKRQEHLDWLGSEKDNTKIKILSNARCLSEGIDIPDVNGIFFSQPKSSQSDLIQAIGRCLRKPSEDKKYGYVIVPFMVPKDKNVQEALNDSKYDKLLESIQKLYGRLLLSLKSMGVDIESMIISKMYEKQTSEEKEQIPEKIENFDTQLLLQNVEVHIIKFSEKDYLDDWSNKLNKILPKVETFYDTHQQNHKDSIEHVKMLFTEFTKDRVSDEDIKEIVIQHLVLSNILELVLNEKNFFQNNTISKEINHLTNQIFDKQKREDFEKEILQELNNIDKILGDKDEKKKDFLKNLFEQFYKSYSSKGKRDIVYTPDTIVQYMIKGTDFLIGKYFDTSYLDKSLHVLDPFSGTGTFLTEVLEFVYKKYKESYPENYNKKENKDKALKTILSFYQNNLHFNEHNLMAYYMSHLFLQRFLFREFEKREEFVQGVYCDTLEQLSHDHNQYEHQKDLGFDLDTDSNVSKSDLNKHDNIKKLETQNKIEMTVIISNPPYTAQQQQDTGNPNKSYKELTEKQYKSYGKGSSLKALFVKSIFWASERIGEQGIISYIVPRPFLEGNSYIGMRKGLQKSFDSIYILDGTSEKGKSFFKDNRTQQCILFLVKVNTSKDTRQAKIYYKDLLDKKESKDKLNFVKITSFEDTGFVKLEVDYKRGLWFYTETTDFEQHMSLSTKKCTYFKTSNPIFEVNYPQLVSSRDYWVYDKDKDVLKKKVQFFLRLFNDSIETNNKHKELPWNGDLRKEFEKGKRIEFDESKIHTCLYYPFSKQYIYLEKNLFHHFPKAYNLFGSKLDQENIIILFEVKNQYSISYNKLNSVFFQGSNIPLYVYKDDKQTSNISKEALETFQKHYKTEIAPEDIFYYVYAVLQSSEYRRKYKNEISNLKAQPRIPLYRNFNELSRLGKKLSDVNVHFEKQPKNKEMTLKYTQKQVTKKEQIKVGIKEKEYVIILDTFTKFSNIPKNAFLDKHQIFYRIAQTQMGFMLKYAKKDVGKTTLQNSKLWRDSKHTKQHDLDKWNNTTRPYLIEMIPRIVTCAIETHKLKEQIRKASI